MSEFAASIGSETECLVVPRGLSDGPSVIAQDVVDALRCRHRHFLSMERYGAFFRRGAVTLDQDFLELSSWPGQCVASALAHEDALIGMVRSVRVQRPGGEADFAVVPVADDGSAGGSSLGHHISLLFPLTMDREACENAVLSLVVLLSGITGAGGFRRGRGELRFHRDPRAAHVRRLRSRYQWGQAYRSVFKAVPRAVTFDRMRVEVTALGAVRGRLDRVIRTATLLLLTSYVGRARGRWPLDLLEPLATLHGNAWQRWACRWRGRRRRWTRGEMLLALLEEVLLPEAGTPEGVVFGADEGLAWIRRAVEASDCRDPAEAVFSAPLQWCVLAHVARQLERRHGPSRKLNESLATAALLAGDLRGDSVRRWLVRSIEGAPYSFEDVFGTASNSATVQGGPQRAASESKLAQAFVHRWRASRGRRRAYTVCWQALHSIAADLDRDDGVDWDRHFTIFTDSSFGSDLSAVASDHASRAEARTMVSDEELRRLVAGISHESGSRASAPESRTPSK